MTETTRYAPAERSSNETIKAQSEQLFNNVNIRELYSAVTDIVLILNKERQVVFYNQNLLDALGIRDIQGQKICGFRPGELLDCLHAFESEMGCGTTEFCQKCGAVNAILSSQKGIQATQECRIVRRNADALDLRVRATPITLNDEQYTVFAITDISHEKRRKALERIFFHDIMNTAVGVRGLSELFSMIDESQVQEFKDMIHTGAEKLVDEIRSQKELSAAESSELPFNPIEMSSLDLLKNILSIYRLHEVAKEKNLVIDPSSRDIVLVTDKTILSRVIGNMTKNALEASQSGDTVTIGCDLEGDNIKFWVKNPTFIPRDIQLQLFQRSFSTKGAGRGLGTYSMKLLSERYLQGTVSFTSIKDQGTTFMGIYPLRIQS